MGQSGCRAHAVPSAVAVARWRGVTLIVERAVAHYRGLDAQTERLLALETTRTRYAVHVRPELVVEIAIDGVQRSSRYPGGVALRFARVKGYREDKQPADADTIDTLRAMLR